MQIIWIFEDGHLKARNQTGELMRWWSAEAAIGLFLADLLNRDINLTRLILWPLLEDSNQIDRKPSPHAKG